MIRLLLGNGANSTSLCIDMYMHLPLARAFRDGDEGVVRLLLEYGSAGNNVGS